MKTAPHKSQERNHNKIQSESNSTRYYCIFMIIISYFIQQIIRLGQLDDNTCIANPTYVVGPMTYKYLSLCQFLISKTANFYLHNYIFHLFNVTPPCFIHSVQQTEEAIDFIPCQPIGLTYASRQ